MKFGAVFPSKTMRSREKQSEAAINGVTISATECKQCGMARFRNCLADCFVNESSFWAGNANDRDP
ncbi:tRNA modification GTPase [Brucella melitensis NI]|nr:tRNA modification GTPase [Brucella melitensis NI]